MTLHQQSDGRAGLIRLRLAVLELTRVGWTQLPAESGTFDFFERLGEFRGLRAAAFEKAGEAFKMEVRRWTRDV
ncbi:MAG: hypothetical protein HFF17_03610 [Oscillospiraceae bacterium]|nr:hypothetical protein [Oscillospiraceae bacterium]